MLPDDMLAAMDERIAKEVAGSDGFWTSTACDEYQRFARELLDGGHHPEWIVESLAGLYGATGGEYGA